MQGNKPLGVGGGNILERYMPGAVMRALEKTICARWVVITAEMTTLGHGPPCRVIQSKNWCGSDLVSGI